MDCRANLPLFRLFPNNYLNQTFDINNRITVKMIIEISVDIRSNAGRISFVVNASVFSP